jgi:hypothetical protein
VAAAWQAAGGDARGGAAAELPFQLPTLLLPLLPLLLLSVRFLLHCDELHLGLLLLLVLLLLY